MVEKISLQAVTREQAYANLNAQKARQQVPKGIAYMAGIFGLIPILYISLEGPHPIAISAVVILYGLVTACLWWTWSLARQAGYRINRRFAAVGWLPVIVVAAGVALLLLWALTSVVQALAPDAGRRAGVGIVASAVWGGIAVCVFYFHRITLFYGNAVGLTFRRNKHFMQKWQDVAQVVIARSTDTVEIAVAPAPGAVVEAMPTRTGEVLTGYPVRVRVPAERFDPDRLKWVLNQSGQSNIALVEQTPAGQAVLGHSNRWT